MKDLKIIRKASQLFFLLLFVYILWSTTYPLQGLIPPAAIFKLDPLIMALTILAGRTLLAGLELALLMAALSLAFGRFFCGWVCPLGTMVDFAGPLSRRRGRVFFRMSRVKYFLLLAAAVAGLLKVQVAWPFDPLVIAGRFVSLNLIPSVTLAIDKAFQYLISTFHLYGGVYDLYRDLKSSFLGIDPRYFSHSLFILGFFLALLGYAAFVQRGWCRHFCPLGAFYALLSRFSLIRREAESCVRCMRCVTQCPMGAIREDLSYDKGECILCLACVSGCPQRRTRFLFGRPRPEAEPASNGITRRQFLSFALASAAAGIAVPSLPLLNRKKPRKVLRPPGSLAEEEFTGKCIRCGNCMKVCITNGLQPLMLQGGLTSIWTPQLSLDLGYCEYRCTLCGSVCPTGAIPSLTVEEKLQTRIGLARIDRDVCIPWKKKKECLVCEEHCPVAEKAIKLKDYTENGRTIRRPYIDLKLCIGCGICTARCPTKPRKAVMVYPVKVTHGKPRLPASDV